MTIILVILTMAIIFSFEIFRRSRRKEVNKNAELVTEHPASFDVFDRYFHPGHTWALVSGPRGVIVGSDDFSSRIIGKIATIDLPVVGQLIQQGEPLACLHHGMRRLAQIAPISGKVIAINKKLKDHPELLNESPFEHGWIAKVLPSSLDTDLRNLLKGFVADGWRDGVRTKFIQLFSSRIGVVMQDGGQLVSDLGECFSDEEWNLIIQKFFPLVLPNKNQHTQ